MPQAQVYMDLVITLQKIQHFILKVLMPGLNICLIDMYRKISLKNLLKLCQ